jgi:hypothetical protein
MATEEKTGRTAVSRLQKQVEELAAQHAGSVAELADFLKRGENVAEAARQALHDLRAAGVLEAVDSSETCPAAGDNPSNRALSGEEDRSSAGADRAGSSELDGLVEWALELRAWQRAPIASERESELLEQINQGLPEDLARRLERLIAKRQAEALTDDEHAELIGLGNEAERLEARRVQALADLARARRTTVPRLMQALGLTGARRD